MSYSIKSIHIYPIKSLQGIELKSANLVSTGLEYDRQWMLVDENNQFITQRSLPLMATFKTAISNNQLIVSASNGENIHIDLDSKSDEYVDVVVWRDTVTAMLENQTINDWFSKQLDTSCRLVKLSTQHKRLVDTDFAKNQETVSFADGFPLLVVSQSSIDLLNSKLEEEASMNRFRPNIVIDGLEPHAEDKLHTITINQINIDLVKPCSRCNVPSIDQHTGEKRKDILRTLIKYRQFNKLIYFGMNGIHQQCGQLEVGQSVSVTP